ncbi:sensor histidine kinase [Mesoaciditoga lauensis]|uniref:sensor histidine kinase n=1 Tax=Mesoaciditoga lauensis TaxID=1495039 RepID=UPI0006906499|nr:ATP-binding protein [Mesoaciditoga lauensis]
MDDEILDFVKEGIVKTNENFEILYFNKAFKKMFPTSFLNEGKREKIIEVLSFSKMNTAFEVADKGKTFCEEAPVYFGGNRIECKITVFKKDNVMNWIFEDITSFKVLEDAKADFVSAVSHEFMTPLGVIQGFLSIIGDPQMNPPLREKYVNRAMAQLKRLEKLVDQLLSLSELEMKKYVPNFSTVNLSQMIAEAKEEMAYRWKEKNVDVEINCPTDLYIETDENALYRILTNLLSNAIKYSFENGKVTISAKAMNDYVAISFEDHGIGIKEEEVPRIFERFYRATNSTRTGAKGMGLGLSLVKHLCEVINAKVDVKSQYMIGSVFTLKLKKDV